MKKTLMAILMILIVSVFSYADVTVDWDDNPASDNVITYTVYFYKTSAPDVVYHQNSATSEITFSQDLFEMDEDYSFYVTASNTAGESVPSNIVNAVVRESVTIPGDVLPDPIIINKPATITITITVE